MSRHAQRSLNLLLLTLARNSELRLARWEHIDSKRGNGSSRSKHEDEQTAHRNSLKRPFAANALEGLTFDMDPFTIHDSRRTAATLLAENGLASDVIEKALAHEKEGIRGVYNLAEHAAERKQML
jgi:integrase